MLSADKTNSSLSCHHRFFKRHGGVSNGLYKSLNVGRSVGDHPGDVRENFRIVKEKSGVRNLISAHQVHGVTIEVIDNNMKPDQCVDGADALVTNIPDIALMVQLADCQGVLLHDPERSVIAAVHSGWRGSVAGILSKTITRMTAVFGSKPAHLKAFVSPSLGPCCAEFKNYRTELPPDFHPFQVKPYYFDFWKITRYQLQSVGVEARNIHISGICTSCSGDYFSYRRACRTGDGRTGRHCAVIGLQSGN